MDKLNRLLARADALKEALRATQQWDQTSIHEAIRVEYTYDSNRIEGNTLTLRETDLVIHNGITIQGKPLSEHLEAVNHYEAVGYINDVASNKVAFNRSVLLSLHSLILKSIDDKHAGAFRTVPVMISGSRHTPPQPWQIEKLIEDYFYFYETSKDELHPIILAAEMHERLATIHPFIDGNGRAARLVMNLILLQHRFPIAIIQGDADSRLAYYAALEKSNLEQDKSDFHCLIVETVLAAQQRLLDMAGC